MSLQGECNMAVSFEFAWLLEMLAAKGQMKRVSQQRLWITHDPYTTSEDGSRPCFARHPLDSCDTQSASGIVQPGAKSRSKLW